MNDVLGTGEGAATAAFVAFFLTMTLGRVVGDRLTPAWGAVALTRRAGPARLRGLGVTLLFDGTLVAVIDRVLGAGPRHGRADRLQGRRPEHRPTLGGHRGGLDCRLYRRSWSGRPRSERRSGCARPSASSPSLAALIAVLAGATRPPRLRPPDAPRRQRGFRLRARRGCRRRVMREDDHGAGGLGAIPESRDRVGRGPAASSRGSCDPLVQQLDERVLRSIVHADVGVRLVLGPPPEVDHGRLPRQLRLELDLDVAVLRLDESGRMTCASATASWIGEPSNPYVWEWKRL